MKAVILAGGLGTRISEETWKKPKPMIEIGGKPILWHIMKHYSIHNINEFIICCGYKGYLIKEYFANYFLHNSDVTIDIKNNKIEVINEKPSESWIVTLVDTGENTMTGGRIKRISKLIDDTFCLTYGDGVSDTDISSSVRIHKKNQLYATMTVVQPTNRFGRVRIENEKITQFKEKPDENNDWINGGFFVFEPELLDYIADDNTILEKEPLEKLTNEKQIGMYKHTGFWQSMDTFREKQLLEELWDTKKAPWKTW